MVDLPRFHRPTFDGSIVLSYTASKATVKREVGEAKIVYDGFLDNDLLPKQNDYAEVLENYDDWRESPQEADALLSEFQNYPCINDPTEGVLEQIVRPQHGYPTLLAVLLNSPSCTQVIEAQNLDGIHHEYRFFADGKSRMLAYEFLPWEDEFDRFSVAEKYDKLGCEVGTPQMKKCLIIPKTDHFRSEGDNFYSRPYFGNFDVLAVCDTLLD